MTEKQLLVRELLLLLGSQPKKLKETGPDYAAKLAIQLGNTILSLSYSLERGQPQQWQSLAEEPTSLFALGQMFREVGLLLFDQKAPSEVTLDALATRLKNLELKMCERQVVE